MTIATKNGSVIIKDGSVAQNCGCCDDPCCVDYNPPGTYRRVGPGCGWPLLVQFDNSTFYPIGTSASGLVDVLGFSPGLSMGAPGGVKQRTFTDDAGAFAENQLYGAIGPGSSQAVDTFGECDHAVFSCRFRLGYATAADCYINFRIDSGAFVNMNAGVYGQYVGGVLVSWPEFSASLEYGGVTLSESWGPPAAGLVAGRSLDFQIGTLEYTERNPAPLASGCLTSADDANNGHEKRRHAYINQSAFGGPARLRLDIPSMGKAHDFTITLHPDFFAGCKTCSPPSDACNPLP